MIQCACRGCISRMEWGGGGGGVTWRPLWGVGCERGMEPDITFILVWPSGTYGQKRIDEVVGSFMSTLYIGPLAWAGRGRTRANSPQVLPVTASFQWCPWKLVWSITQLLTVLYTQHHGTGDINYAMEWHSHIHCLVFLQPHWHYNMLD